MSSFESDDHDDGVVRYGHRVRGRVVVGRFTFDARLVVVVVDDDEADDGTTRTSAVVESLEISFDEVEKHHPRSELEELASIARRTRNVARTFRNVVAFSAFDARRERFLRDDGDDDDDVVGPRRERSSARRFRLTTTTTSGAAIALVLDWTFRFSLFGRGAEDLSLVDVVEEKERHEHEDESPSPNRDADEASIEPRRRRRRGRRRRRRLSSARNDDDDDDDAHVVTNVGLQRLVDTFGGDRERALRALMVVLTASS